MMILALAAEVSALRDRLDTHERLADSGKPASTESVESYQPPEAVEADRAASRLSLIDRVTRALIDPATPRKTHDDPTDES
jgi:hypothetical protein